MKDTKIVLASGNEGKLRELHSILSTLGVELISQRALGVDDADETGLTFVENALIKARHACEVTGLPAIADDSGIEVDEIDAANNALLLERLQGVAPAQRTARFQCIIVLLKHAADPTPLICQGTWEGVILDSAEGTNGFGYDPLFFVPSHNCASALLDPHIKNAISHRGQALEQLRRCWPSHL